jgi:hypothetical protein
VLSDEIDYVLIPRAGSRNAYLYGDLPWSTPLHEFDPTNKGALINSALDGESADLVWKVTYSTVTKQWVLTLSLLEISQLVQPLLNSCYTTE